MDAGAKCGGDTSSIAAWIYIYFYTFRICAVWIVIPTLMSFLIQSFIQKLSKPVVVKPQSFIWQLLPPNQIHENSRWVILLFLISGDDYHLTYIDQGARITIR